MADGPKYQDEPTVEEAAKRRDEALKRALKTPPKPHKPKQAKNGDSRRKLSPKKRD